MTARHDRAVRWARRWTLASFLAFGVFYLYVANVTWFNWGQFDTCYVHGARYEPDAAEVSSSFPFTSTCSADYVLVPTWANPTIVVLGAVCLISLALLGAASIRRRRALSSAS
jgi:hypothetical protein